MFRFNQCEINLGYSFISGLLHTEALVATTVQVHVVNLDQPLQKNVSSSIYTCGQGLCLGDLPTDFIVFIVVLCSLTFDRKSDLKDWPKF